MPITLLKKFYYMSHTANTFMYKVIIVTFIFLSFINYNVFFARGVANILTAPAFNNVYSLLILLTDSLVLGSITSANDLSASVYDIVIIDPQYFLFSLFPFFCSSFVSRAKMHRRLHTSAFTLASLKPPEKKDLTVLWDKFLTAVFFGGAFYHAHITFYSGFLSDFDNVWLLRAYFIPFAWSVCISFVVVPIVEIFFKKKEEEYYAIAGWYLLCFFGMLILSLILLSFTLIFYHFWYFPWFINQLPALDLTLPPELVEPISRLPKKPSFTFWQELLNLFREIDDTPYKEACQKVLNERMEWKKSVDFFQNSQKLKYEILKGEKQHMAKLFAEATIILLAAVISILLKRHQQKK